jgi:4-amino-4-deoxy-L-arabinose transferase-like glycosyltransferase
VRPPVYHDEFVICEGAWSILERGYPSSCLFDSRPETESILGGSGRLEIVIGVGFHYLNAGWTWLVGESAAGERAFSSVSGLVVALLLLRIGSLVGKGSWAGVLAALFWILDPSVNVAARTVRLDVPTAAVYLAAAWVGIELGSRVWARVASGLLLGLGLTMHPVGAIAAPAVVFLALARTDGPWRARARSLAPFALGALVALAPYVALVVARLDQVREMLGVHAAHRSLPELGWVGRLRAFFLGQHVNAFSAAVGTPHAAIVGVGV